MLYMAFSALKHPCLMFRDECSLICGSAAPLVASRSSSSKRTHDWFTLLFPCRNLQTHYMTTSYNEPPYSPNYTLMKQDRLERSPSSVLKPDFISGHSEGEHNVEKELRRRTQREFKRWQNLFYMQYFRIILRHQNYEITQMEVWDIYC